MSEKRDARSVRLLLLAMFIAEATSSFEGTMIFAAMPRFMREFGNPITVGWLVTGSTLIGTSVTLMSGRIGERLGVRRAMVAMIALSLLGAVFSALSVDFTTLLIGRSIQGVGGAVFPLSIVLLRMELAPARVPMGVGLITSAASVGAASGFVLGGVILDHFDWRWMFWANAAMLGLSLVVVRLFVPQADRPANHTRIDWIDGMLPAPAICSILLGVSLSRQTGGYDQGNILLIVGGICALIFWGRRSLRLAEPFVDLRLLANRNAALANLIAILIAMGTMQSAMIFSPYVQSPSWTMVGLGFSATVAGLAKLPSNFLSLFAGPFSGWISQKAGNRTALVGGTALIAFSWLIGMSLPDTIYGVIALMCGISFGTTMLFAAIPNTVVDCVPVERTGEAIGVIMVMRGLFLGVGAQIITILLASDVVVQGSVSLPSAVAYKNAMGWIATLSAMALALSLFVPRGTKTSARLKDACAGVPAE